MADANTPAVGAAPAVNGAVDPAKSEQQLERQRRKKEAQAAKKAAFEKRKAEQASKGKVAAKGAGARSAKKTLRLKTAFVNNTPKGEKKDVSTPLADSYDPPAVEAAWYDWWVKQGYFHADPKDVILKGKTPFVMVIPPPNVTGSLHLGHALTNSVEDTLVRWHRMKGEVALWVPGVDHAGIATQVVVEKKLMRTEGKTRHDLGREAFVKKVWEWKEEYGDRIFTQLKRLGSSLDWEREVFTMDEKLNVAVTEAFVRMYEGKGDEKGIIYRATRLVNWDCVLKTAISDIEVEHVELTGKTKMRVPGYGDKTYDFGVMDKFAYQIEDSDEKITIATTRLETMLADTGIAVHPRDERYKHLHGKNAIHPFSGRKIPIVCDGELVDMDFGTGIVKVTPAHDHNDFECGRRNKLETINMLNDDGTVNEVGGEQFQGLKRFDARVMIAKALKEKGLYIEQVDHAMSLGICSRSKDVIEPVLKPQWYVNCEDMAARAVKAVREKELEIIPATHEATWFRWLDGEAVRPWCISRQLWWGHRIPAYLVSIKGREEPDDQLMENWVVARSEAEAMTKAKARFPDVADGDITLAQDPDVLDTWFSSGLFPFSVFGWPNNTEDLEAFFPTSLLETGHDILFFWVARMVMMSLHLTDKLPFKQVFLHAMVRDAHGRKMSKALGNVLDPVDVMEGIELEALHEKLKSGNLDPREVKKAIEGQKTDFPKGISECGTDALRFSMCAYTSQGKNINLDINRVIAYRNFCNKLWNAYKLILMKLDADFKPDVTVAAATTPLNEWIISRLAATVNGCDKCLIEYELGGATTTIHDFFLKDFCDVYLEAIKPVFNGDNEEEKEGVRQTLYTCFETALRLLHPFMPFLTEELWQRLPKRVPEEAAESIMIAAYPTPNEANIIQNDTVEQQMTLVLEIVRAVRQMRSAYNVLKKHTPAVHIRVSGEKKEELEKFLESFSSHVVTLAGAGQLDLISVDDATPTGCATTVLNKNISVLLLIKGFVDVAVEVKKLENRTVKLSKERDQLVKRAAGNGYSKMPEDVKAKNAERLEEISQQVIVVAALIEDMKKLSAE